jgi:hypothetical protein
MIEVDERVIEARVVAYSIHPPSISLQIPRQSQFSTIPVPASVIERGFKSHSEEEMQSLRRHNCDLTIEIESLHSENIQLKNLLYVFEGHFERTEDVDLYAAFSEISSSKLVKKKRFKTVRAMKSSPFEVDLEG